MSTESCFAEDSKDTHPWVIPLNDLSKASLLVATFLDQAGKATSFGYL